MQDKLFPKQWSLYFNTKILVFGRHKNVGTDVERNWLQRAGIVKVDANTDTGTS